MDSESRLRDSLRVPLSINNAQFAVNNFDRSSGTFPYSSGSNYVQQSTSRALNSYAGRGRGRYNNRLQCQLCWKLGHLVDWCFHRFNQNFAGVTAQTYSPRSVSVVGVNSCAFSEPTGPSDFLVESYCSYVPISPETYCSYVPTMSLPLISKYKGLFCPLMQFKLLNLLMRLVKQIQSMLLSHLFPLGFFLFWCYTSCDQ
ncbi:hypothetical protein ES319_D13G161700v1 [Gossypium barbadense]|uniref:Uncharacterized protein n=2 Tax=Gossypium TaxID=3633 RepID=A0A5J5NMI6_GOSBA|nr:hypothetical protein ES319_D13G161700v1 [Gossypium barbadense]TYH35136.1 hypothetical protein ES332_D13G172800v1 [Gossypium tomentosum]